MVELEDLEGLEGLEDLEELEDLEQLVQVEDCSGSKALAGSGWLGWVGKEDPWISTMLGTRAKTQRWESARRSGSHHQLLTLHTAMASLMMLALDSKTLSLMS